ncbi:MAG TPA: response regulator [Candidatus Binataceae bacterium]|nr:response regulator [Candidatus Binataceae bacterium]
MSEPASWKEVDILLVEDNPGDIRLTMELLKESKIRNRIEVVTDGESAVDFLYRRGPYANAFRPDLVLLDLNLPGKDGRAVLEEVKNQPQFRQIPVVVLTTSSADEDVLRSYDLRANCYITKPVTIDQFTRIIQQIQNFWLTIVKLPEA